MMYINVTKFKNIREIDGLDDIYYDGRDMMYDICCELRRMHKRIIKTPFTTMFFDGVVSGGYTSVLRSYIKKHKLGDVISTVSKMNPNSGNRIRVCIWEINKRTISKWFKNNRKKYE